MQEQQQSWEEDQRGVDILSFFQTYLSTNYCSRHQPITVLQSRYPTKSVKTWFQCNQHRELHDLWWTSDIILPKDVAVLWKVHPVHSSGNFPLTTNHEHQDKATASALLLLTQTLGTDDLLHTLCGEWKLSSSKGTVQFKTKKAAQKSAAFNLLLSIELGSMKDKEVVEIDDIQVSTARNNNTTRERFELQVIRYHGAVTNSDGEFISNCNPCMIQCSVSIKVVNGSSTIDDCLMDITSDCHPSENDSFNDTVDKLRRGMMARGATDNDILHILTAMEVSKPNILYETTQPRWVNTALGSTLYLLELKYSVVTDGGEEIPLSEAIGLDASEAARVGIICGCGVYDVSSSSSSNVERDWLSIDFTLCGEDTVRVRMTNQTELTIPDMILQMKWASPKIDHRECECPITLIKCLNRIIFDEGKTYAKGPMPSVGNLLKRISEDGLVPTGCHRSYMFVPLRPRSINNMEVDWKIISAVVNHESSTATGRPLDLLRNRFLQQTGLGGRLFVATCGSSETSNSSLVPEDMISRLPDNIREKIVSSFDGLQLSEISYRMYYEQIGHHSIKNSTDPLIGAVSLVGLSYENHESTLFHRIYRDKPSTLAFDSSSLCSISNYIAARGLLVSELTTVLPMPRDFLYLCQRAHNYIGKLERAHTLLAVANRFCELQQNSGLQMVNATSAKNIVPLIDKATTFCREHERLETLGDSVLLHFIVLNLFEKVMHSSTAEFILDIFDQVIMKQGKNKVLLKAALQIGLPRLIIDGKLASAKSCRNIQAGNSRPTIVLSNGQLSDTLESLLGATILIDPSGCMTVGLLNEMGSCFPCDSLPFISADRSGGTWFSGKGTCLTTGYPFYEYPGMIAELEQIRGILKQNHRVHLILEQKCAAFCQLLSKRTSRQDQIEFLQSGTESSLLLHSALFDDSLDDVEDYPDWYSLERLAKLRDTIFNVGNAALQLSVVSEMYHIYPAITSGDFHLMKTALMSHDTLAYIFIKNGFHDCLFDENSDSTIEMQCYMNAADLLWSNEWAKHGGWVIHGGSDEFQRRVQHHGYHGCPNPQYIGLSLGRLRGHMEKLPSTASEDLSFSMKSIVGAIALSIGVKDAWKMFQPFFLELMMLSPDELRICFAGKSDLASCYQKGRK